MDQTQKMTCLFQPAMWHFKSELERTYPRHGQGMRGERAGGVWQRFAPHPFGVAPFEGARLGEEVEHVGMCEWVWLGGKVERWGNGSSNAAPVHLPDNSHSL